MNEEEITERINQFLYDCLCDNVTTIPNLEIGELLDLYNQEKEKNKKLEEIINNLAKAVKFMGTNDELTADDIIKMFSPEEIKMNFDDFIKRWEKEQNKERKLKDKVIDMMAEYISNSDIDEDICRQFEMKEDCYADTTEDNSACLECVKQYYFKKARGEEDVKD